MENFFLIHKLSQKRIFLVILLILAASFCITSCTKEIEEDEERLNPVLPIIPPPLPETRRFSVESPHKVHGGERVRIKVTSNGEPIPGVELELNGDKVYTDTNGLAEFIAPEVKRPHTYYISIRKEGFVYYLEDPPDIIYQMTGWYPLGIELIVFPSIPMSMTGINPSIEFEIDEPLGLWDGATSFSDLIEKADKAGYDSDENWWAESKEISAHLKDKDGEDIWIFFGHANDANNDGTVDGLTGIEDRGLSGLVGGKLKSYSKRKLDRDLRADGDPPGIVFLGGCHTEDLLDNLIQTCVKVAAGFDNTIPLAMAANALKIFWEALLDGKTLDEAIREANDMLSRNAGGLFNPQSARLVVRTKDWLNDPGTKTLRELIEAKRP